MDDLFGIWILVFGDASEEVSLPQMAARAVVVYLAALVMVRWGEKRFMGKSTAFDVILGVILGSVVSRGINGSTGLLSAIASGAVLVLLHWIFASIAFRSDRFGNVVKGSSRVLVKDGAIDWEQMRKANMSRDDLLGALRLEGVRDPEGVKEARLERSGDVSVVKGQDGPRILEASLEGGTLTVRLKIE